MMHGRATLIYFKTEIKKVFKKVAGPVGIEKTLHCTGRLSATGLRKMYAMAH